MSIRYMMILAILTAGIGVYAQNNSPELNAVTEAEAQAETMKRIMAEGVDSPTIHLRAFSADSFRTIANDQSFAWMQYADSFYRNRYKAEEIPNEQQKQKRQFSSNWVKMLLWTAAIVALLLLVWKLIGGNSALLSRSNKSIKPETLQDEHETTPQQINRQLNDAIAQGAYRQAVRLRFIQLLQRLAQKGLIAIHPSKTNRQYLGEIGNPMMKPALAGIMLQYEYVWYGEFDPDPQQFESINNQFKTFEQQWA